MRSFLIILLSLTLHAAETAQWDQGDPVADGVEGTRTAKAYKELKLKPPAQPILVAVIDSGVDIAHEDLQANIWINAKEKTGKAGIDDDRNGFIDDLNGWNFLGSKDGKRQVIHGTLEVTREYARLIREKATGTLPADQEPYLSRVEQEYFSGRTQGLQQFMAMAAMGLQYDQMIGELRKLGLREITPAAITELARSNPQAQKPAAQILGMASQGMSGDQLKQNLRTVMDQVIYHYDAALDESAIIGDDPGKLDEIGYGNSGVAVQEAYHGTHVAGIIGSVRGNGNGIDGQCEWVRILPIVVVPDGDERDKDVANGIRYAVDRGAKIINCSFGKAYSPNREEVEKAIRYAEAKGVLIVHGSGNSGADIDGADNFPSPIAISEGKPHRFTNWIEVGASAQKADKELLAEFSNYGKATVDLFAPGVEIRSTIPGGGTEDAQGTSMASPEVAGVAALVWSQYPRLTAAEVRAVLLITVRTFPGLQVRKPGTRNEMTTLADVSLTGGIVDAFAALTYLEVNRGKVKPEDLKTVEALTARALAIPGRGTETGADAPAEDGKGKEKSKDPSPAPITP